MGTVNINKVMAVFAILACVLIIVTGVIGCVKGVPGKLRAESTIDNINAEWAVFFFCIGLIVFGIFGILGEANVDVFIAHFSVFARFWTKAVWYIIMGFFTLGIAGALGIATAAFCWLVGLMFLIFHFVASPTTKK